MAEVAVVEAVVVAVVVVGESSGAVHIVDMEHY
jgi:hypothetical protein